MVTEARDERYAPGDKVLACGANLGELYDGGLAEMAQVDGESLVALPDDFSTREAMIYGTAGFTAALAMVKLLRNERSPGLGPIAVTGAPGGVGPTAPARRSPAPPRSTPPFPHTTLVRSVQVHGVWMDADQGDERITKIFKQASNGSLSLFLSFCSVAVFCS